MDFKIWVNSDDLGASVTSSRQILDCWLNGELDGFSILPNGSALAYVQQILLKNSNKSARIAAHLNLTEGPATADLKMVPHLVDSRGNLQFSFGKLFFIWISGVFLNRNTSVWQEIETEWRAQIQSLRSICGERTIDVVDSHQHIHMIPPLFEIASKLASEFNISSIRISREYFVPPRDLGDWLKPFFLVNIVKYFLLKALSYFVRRRATDRHLKFPAGVIGILYSGHMNFKNMSRSIDFFKKRGISDLEVIVHVGRVQIDEVISGRSGVEDPFYSSVFRDIERASLADLKQMRGSSF